MQAEAEISGEVFMASGNSTASVTDPYISGSRHTQASPLAYWVESRALWTLTYSGDWTHELVLQPKIPN